MTESNSGLYCLLLTVGIFLCLRQVSERGLRATLTPLTRWWDRLVVTVQVRRGVSQSDTSDSEDDTPPDTPPDTQPDTLVAGGALIVGKPQTSRIQVPRMVTFSDESGNTQELPVESSASSDLIIRWVATQIAKNVRRQDIISEGQTLFAVSESTMSRRYRDATQHS